MFKIGDKVKTVLRPGFSDLYDGMTGIVISDLISPFGFIRVVFSEHSSSLFYSQELVAANKIGQLQFDFMYES